MADLLGAIWTDHARTSLRKRGLNVYDAQRVLRNPESVTPVRLGRVVVQGEVRPGFLLRVFVDIDREPAEIVTLYLTSKLRKYRGGRP